MSNVEIKPCPFCNGEAQLKHHCNAEYFSCECNSCKTQNRIVETREEAIENWNTRRPDQAIENAAYERAKMVVADTEVKTKDYYGDDGLATLNDAIANIDKLKSSPAGEGNG